MVFKRDNKNFFYLEDSVSFSSFVKRLNNFYSNLDKHIQEDKDRILKLEQDIVALTLITGDNTPEYKRKDYLEALRADNRVVMDEIEKMSKQKDYKSSFVTKSTLILENLNKNKEIKQDSEIKICH